jgi:tetratricopeptide (TPR) repeat protein
LATACANLAETLVETGRFAEARAWIDRAVDAAAAVNDGLVLADATFTRARAEAGEGDDRAAVASAEEAARLFADAGARTWVDQARALAASARSRLQP